MWQCNECCRATALCCKDQTLRHPGRHYKATQAEQVRRLDEAFALFQVRWSAVWRQLQFADGPGMRSLMFGMTPS